MKTKMTVTLSILAAGLLIAVVAWAQKAEKPSDRQGLKGRHAERQGDRKGGGCHHGKDGDRGGGFHLERMTADLGLLADQRAKIDGILAEDKKVAEPARIEVKALRDKMRAEWEATSPKEGTLISLERKIHDIKGKLAEQQIATRVDIISILTDAQRAKMRAHMADRGPKDGRGRGNGGGKGFHRRQDGFGPGPDAKNKSF